MPRTSAAPSPPGARGLGSVCAVTKAGWEPRGGCSGPLTVEAAALGEDRAVPLAAERAECRQQSPRGFLP